MLVLGNYNTYRQLYDSTIVELGDPATNGWRTTEPLSKARGEYVAVPLLDGRALVTGGINESLESFSSTYLFDPQTERWEKSGLMGTARAGAAGAVLKDGRVLVTGGGYYTGIDYGLAPGAILAGYSQTQSREGSAGQIRLADVEPPRAGYALATAELFDPATGTWSPTGSMRYAREGASAVTLGDGRVLVWSIGWDPSRGDEQAQGHGEMYDPATGRFSVVEPPPEIDRSSLDALGVPVPSGSPESWPFGRLVPLAGGGALLLGTNETWGPLTIQRMFRFEAATDSWVVVGEPLVVGDTVDEGDPANSPSPPSEWGVRHPDGLVAPLADGSLLFAGGGAERAAELLDPGSGAWSSLPPMPAARLSGTAVTLADGSALIVGGTRTPSDPEHSDFSELVADALRFIRGS